MGFWENLEIRTTARMVYTSRMRARAHESVSTRARQSFPAGSLENCRTSAEAIKIVFAASSWRRSITPRASTCSKQFRPFRAKEFHAHCARRKKMPSHLEFVNTLSLSHTHTHTLNLHVIDKNQIHCQRIRILFCGFPSFAFVNQKFKPCMLLTENVQHDP